jgi:hypothetical protein
MVARLRRRHPHDPPADLMVKLKLTCPDCSGTFRMELEPGNFPDYCPLCSAYVGVDPDFVPSQVNIGTSLGKAGDLTFRQMEQASIDRAESFGQPSMKITNMKDNLREGDVAAMVPQPSAAYQEMTAATPPQFQGGAGMGQPEAVLAAIAGSKAGPRAAQGTGAGVLSLIQGGGNGPPAPRSPLVRGGFG